MGYDIHITRKKEWHAEGIDISEAEWLNYLASDQEFSKPDEYNMVIWTNPSSNKQFPFRFWNQQIIVKDPDKEIVAKMRRISQKLKANVQGDEGEPY